MNGMIKSKRRSLIIVTLIIMAVCAIFALFGCSGEYSGGHTAPATKENKVFYIERNKLGFVRGMKVNTAEIIEKCNCSVINADGESVPVTAELLNTPDFQYEEFELDSLGSNKKITLRYADAENYIFYDVNEYTVNFYSRPGTLWKSIDATYALTDTLALSVWVDITKNNYSTDDAARVMDADGAKLFNGWRDAGGESVTGLHTLRAPSFGNKRVVDLYADYITWAQYDAMDISYNDAGDRVFAGYKGAPTGEVVIPEGVTYVDVAKVFEGEFNFESLHIPSTATLNTPFTFAVNTVGLKSVTVDGGSAEYADFNGALYSKDYRVLYLMPASVGSVDLHGAVNEFESYSCAYLQLREIELPISVNVLRHYCFSYSALKKIKGVEHIKTVMTGAFYKSDVECYDDGVAQYYLRSDGKYILGSVTDTAVEEYTVLPDTVTVSGSAFSGCASLKSITFNDGLESIGDSAFYNCKSLTEVAFPSSLKYMGGSIFYGCAKLQKVTGLPDVTYRDKEGAEYEHTVPYELFRGCSSLTAIRIAESTHTVGPNAFYGCTKLTDVEFNDDLAFIGTSSFYNSGVKKVKFPTGLRGFGTSAFSSSKLEELDLGHCENLVSLPSYCFSRSKLVHVVLPDRIKKIPDHCFYYISTLLTADIGEATELGEYAFSQCSKLAHIDLGNSLVTIKERAFSNCKKLTGVVFPETLKRIEGYVFQNCDAITSLELGKNVEAFGDYTYLIDGITFDSVKFPLWQCYNIESITVDPQNTHFKSVDGVLYGNEVCGVPYGDGGVLFAVPASYNAERLVLPESVKVILPYAVHYQKGIKELVLNDGLENIGKAAFYEAKTIEKLHIPSTVTNIGANIVLNCYSITEFSIAEDNAVYTTDGNLVYAGDKLLMYSSADGNVTVRDGVKEISTGIFMNNTLIETVTIPDSVTTVDYRAFYNCQNLKSITIGKGLTELDPSAFAWLPKLESITVAEDNPAFTVKNNVLYSKDGKKLLLAAAQNGMTDLSDITGVTEIGDWAFADHATLKQAIIPEGVKKIGDYAFYDCKKIEIFRGSQMLETIGERAFSFSKAINDTAQETRFCNTLKTVMLYSSTRYIGDYAFYGQYGIESLYLHMNIAQAKELIAASGRNVAYLTYGNQIGTSGEYYNKVTRYLYSLKRPSFPEPGYSFFYIDEQTGEPVVWD